MVHARDTLIIKHLPPDLNDKSKEELLRNYGALDVKCVSSKLKKYGIVFARFENEQVAYQVLHRLHQLNVNGSLLCVEYTKENHLNFLPGEESQEIEDKEQIENDKLYKKFLEKLNSWHSALDFKQPVPNHLKYQYPPPDNMVISNIAKTLATVPKFYTQVLHLMNKMNLPCPFGKDILQDFNVDILSNFSENKKAVHNEPNNEVPVEPEDETSESEISSDEEIKKQRETIPNVVVKKKRARTVPKFIKPMVITQGITKQKKTNIDEVFEKAPEEKETKRIKLSHPPVYIIEKIMSAAQEPPQTSTGFGFIHPKHKSPSPSSTAMAVRNEMEEERLEKPEILCISSEELEQNRIPEKDRSLLPVFKNYAEGAPTCRLYIKNLAKSVTEEDLKYIYNRYLPKDMLDPYVMDIRLMQEGRMKGQAFVTFHSLQLAQTALKETNGFLLKGKPLVVQFARSAVK